jgi:glycosyltransferase involved in cell wall biosynthesis
MIKVLIASCAYPSKEYPYQGTFVASWANQLKQCGADIRVFKRDHISSATFLTDRKRVQTFYRRSSQYQYVWEDIQVHRQGIRFLLPLDYSKTSAKTTYRKIAPTIRRIRREFPFDLLYLATWGDLSLAMSRIAREMDVPCVASAIGDHTNNYYNKPGSLYYEYHKEIFENSRFVICVSKDMERKVQILTNNTANTFAFYSGVDIRKFFPSQDTRRDVRKAMGYQDDDRMVLFVGRLSAAKGVYELLDAFARLNRETANIKLLLIGAADNGRRINETIQDCSLQDKARWIGAVDHTDIARYMNAADFFVLPSWNEGLPNVIMEACACKVPVLASNVGGIPEIITDGETGYLFEPRNIGELTSKLQTMIADPEAVARVAESAYARVLSTFNYQKNGTILYEKMAALCSA